MVNSESYTEGTAFSHTLDETTTITENGRSKTDSSSIKVSISVMYAPESIVILQMNSGNTVISRTEYNPSEMPDDLTLETEAAYFIVETHKLDNIGNSVISREIYSSDVEGIETFFTREDGFCVKQGTRIINR